MSRNICITVAKQVRKPVDNQIAELTLCSRDPNSNTPVRSTSCRKINTLFWGFQNKMRRDFLRTGSSPMFIVSRLISALSRRWCLSLLWSAIWGDGNGRTSTSFISAAPLSLSASGAFNRCYNVSASVCVRVCVSLLAPHWRLMLRCMTQSQSATLLMSADLPVSSSAFLHRGRGGGDRQETVEDTDGEKI